MAPPPLPPINPNKHQNWADPILYKETRARLGHFYSLGWLPPNYKPKTLEGLMVVKHYWLRHVMTHVAPSYGGRSDFITHLLEIDRQHLLCHRGQVSDTNFVLLWCYIGVWVY
jgi:hypothetical protein